MREQSFLILAALAGGPAHGYGVIQAVDELSEGRGRLRPGTLYAALERLVADGWLVADREEVVDGRNRRYYAVTDEGRAALADEIGRLEANAAIGRRQLGLGSA